MKILLVALLVFSLGCASKTVDKKAEGEKLMQASREWSRTAATRDVEKTLNYWSEDAVLISGSQAPLKGKEAIRQMVSESLKVPGFSISWEPESVEISDNGDMGYLIEKSRVSYPDSTGQILTQLNQAVSIWKKQNDGSWKNVVDISTPAKQ